MVRKNANISNQLQVVLNIVHNLHMICCPVVNIIFIVPIIFRQSAYFFNRIGIRSTVDGSLVKDTSVTNILHCNVSRSFWITWTVDSVKVGQGDVINQPLLTWQSTAVHPILALSVTTGSGNPAHWHFPQEGWLIVARK